MEFFASLEKILTTKIPEEKISLFKNFYQKYKSNQIEFNHSLNSKIFENPSFYGYCKIVPATKVPKRKSLTTKENRAILLHAIAHIEYSAIDLALDHSYRFKNMPKEFYEDWLEVANEEINHFLMLNNLLKEQGYKYGDFPVHAFLFDTCMATLDLTHRMAVIPRYLEASGLDANPKIIKKLEKLNDDFAINLKNILYIILHEEITHVKKGDKWFKWACKKNNIPFSNFYQIVEKYLPGATKKKEFINIEFRKKAGYSCEELEVLSKTKVCK